MTNFNEKTEKELWELLHKYKKMPQSCTTRRLIGNIQAALKQKTQ